VSISIDPRGASRTAVYPASDGRADTVVSNGPTWASTSPATNNASAAPAIANATTLACDQRRRWRSGRVGIPTIVAEEPTRPAA
jgi:hypothetical protein